MIAVIKACHRYERGQIIWMKPPTQNYKTSMIRHSGTSSRVAGTAILCPKFDQFTEIIREWNYNAANQDMNGVMFTSQG